MCYREKISVPECYVDCTDLVGESTSIANGDKVEFFDSKGPSGAPKKTWYLESDSDGKIMLDDAHVTQRHGYKSDPFFMHKGKIVIPIDGYLQFTEVAAPAPYVVKKEPFGMTTGVNDSYQKRVYNDLERCVVEVQKYKDDGSTPIEGVEFELKFLEAKYKLTPDKNQYFQRTLKEGESIIMTTDKEGKLEFTGLDHGRYQLTEVKTNPEYVLVTKPIEFNIPMEMTQSEAESYGNVDFSTGKEDVSYTDKWFFFKCLFEYTNNGKIKLPMTGSTGIWKYTLAGTGIAATLVSCIIIGNSKKNKRKHKKNKRN